jgi:hypothetical protein
MEEEGDYLEAFYVCDYFTLMSESQSSDLTDWPRLNLSVELWQLNLILLENWI